MLLLWLTIAGAAAIVLCDAPMPPALRALFYALALIACLKASGALDLMIRRLRTNKPTDPGEFGHAVGNVIVLTALLLAALVWLC
jgi:hypothetical protein